MTIEQVITEEKTFDRAWDTKEELEYLISTYRSNIKRSNESINRKEKEIEKLKENNEILKEKLKSFEGFLKFS